MTLTILLSLLLAAPTAEAQLFGLTPTSIEQAISTAWPQAARYESVVLEMKGDLRQRIAQRCGSAVPSEPVMLVRVSDAKQQWIGDAVLLDEIGKYRPITFLVAIHPEKRVHDLQVLVYREHIGKQIASPRFTRQFRNRAAQPPFQLHREIRNLSGATLSARASVRAVRRALATVAEVCDGKSPIRWKPWLSPVSSTVEGEVEADRSVPVVRVRPAMGTVLRVEVYGPEAEQVISEVFDEVRRLEELLSRWNPHSDVSRVEQAPAGQPVKVSADTIECVSAALRIARESGGAFDPTLVADGYLQIDVDRATGTITRQRDDLILDLGGIGKGYALDRAAEILRELGHSRALLDFGGQLLALDPPPGESSWLVGIHDPRVKGSGTNSLLCSIPLVGSSLATSATYEKGDHIIDPQQGQAAVVALSTTVLIPDATRADAFSTALAVLGPDHADRLLDRVPGAGALILVAGEKSARGYGKLTP